MKSAQHRAAHAAELGTEGLAHRWEAVGNVGPLKAIPDGVDAPKAQWIAAPRDRADIVRSSPTVI
jgi:hypothetical protein